MKEMFKDFSYLIIMFIAVWLAFYLGTRHDTLEQRMRRYDCRITEFAPDIPNDIREECRRRRLEAFNSRL